MHKIKTKNIVYYVPSNFEKKVISLLKNKFIISGNIRVVDVANTCISDSRLMMIKDDTTAILLYNTNNNNTFFLKKNIIALNKTRRVKKIIHIPQLNTLDDEISHYLHLVNEPQNLNFNSRFSYFTSLINSKDFSIKDFWYRNPQNSFNKFENNSFLIKKF
ncbi:MAG: hypothetical protein RR623_06515 [Bacilli bacterium]